MNDKPQLDNHLIISYALQQTTTQVNYHFRNVHACHRHSFTLLQGAHKLLMFHYMNCTSSTNCNCCNIPAN